MLVSCAAENGFTQAGTRRANKLPASGGRRRRWQKTRQTLRTLNASPPVALLLPQGGRTGLLGGQAAVSHTHQPARLTACASVPWRTPHPGPAAHTSQQHAHQAKVMHGSSPRCQARSQPSLLLRPPSPTLAPWSSPMLLPPDTSLRATRYKPEGAGVLIRLG